MLSANCHINKFLNILLLASIALFLDGAQAKDSPALQKTPPAQSTEEPLASLACDQAFNQTVLSMVDKHVRTQLYSKELSEKTWPHALEKQKQKILASTNLLELSQALNAAIDELKSSHCRFLTINDDTYYFLYSLFASKFANFEKASSGHSVFPGFVTGGAGFEPDRVRFVLEDSPAQKAHILTADKIIAVDGHPYIGQANFFDRENRTINIKLERDSKPRTVSIKLSKKPMYEWYLNAVEKSARRFEKDGLKLGYVHLWCGGEKAQDAMKDCLEDPKLRDCDGLILDLRDGYGACSLDALDPFYRKAADYPDFESTTREGKKSISRLFFDKPVVALINGGSRSGKEALAFSLKQSRRALLVGDCTAGYFLAGQVLAINSKCFLYLAVQDCSLSGTRLEGKGVEPDLKIENDKTRAEDRQLEAAKEELVKRIKAAKSKAESLGRALFYAS